MPEREWQTSSFMLCMFLKFYFIFLICSQDKSAPSWEDTLNRVPNQKDTIVSLLNWAQTYNTDIISGIMSSWKHTQNRVKTTEQCDLYLVLVSTELNHFCTWTRRKKSGWPPLQAFESVVGLLHRTNPDFHHNSFPLRHKELVCLLWIQLWFPGLHTKGPLNGTSEAYNQSEKHDVGRVATRLVSAKDIWNGTQLTGQAGQWLVHSAVKTC